jgi:hypothetical protein
VPGAGMPVPAAAISWPVTKPVTPIPAGSNCAGAVGDYCTSLPESCGVFGTKTCTDTWNPTTTACTCRCL